MTDRADIIITHARVLTLDEGIPHAQALAIAGNRIIAVGTAAPTAAEILGAAPPDDIPALPVPVVPESC